MMKYAGIFLLLLVIARPGLPAGNLSDDPTIANLVYNYRTGSVVLDPDANASGEISSFVINNLIWDLQCLSCWEVLPFTVSGVSTVPRTTISEPFYLGDIFPATLKSPSELADILSAAVFRCRGATMMKYAGIFFLTLSR